LRVDDEEMSLDRWTQLHPVSVATMYRLRSDSGSSSPDVIVQAITVVLTNGSVDDWIGHVHHDDRILETEVPSSAWEAAPVTTGDAAK